MERNNRQGNYSLQRRYSAIQDNEAGTVRCLFTKTEIAETSEDYQDQLKKGIFAWTAFCKDPDSDSIDVMASGIHQLGVVQRTMERLAKWEQRRRDRIAGVYLDEASFKMLEVLGHETSIRWDELTRMTGLEPSDAFRVVALLANAELCEVGPLRIRLSDVGDMILSGETKQELTWDVYGDSNDATSVTQEPDEYRPPWTW